VRIRVITVSDRAFAGEYEDRSGPAIEEVLASAYPEAEFSREIVPDEEELVLAALGRDSGADWIITSGGTGPGPRDRTPEATRAWIERELPGVAEALRAASMADTPFAAFSRGVAGMRGRQFAVNLPGSPSAARQGASFLASIIEHGTAMARGEGHPGTAETPGKGS
jgi:molybdopterin adenylyltransferase